MKHLLLLFFILFFTIHDDLQGQGFLHCNGRYIYDGNGNEVILRGIGTGNWMIMEGYMMQTDSVAGTHQQFRDRLTELIGEQRTEEFYDTWLENHFNKVDVDSMKAWGFNSVRVAMHYKWFTPPIEDEPVPGEITWIDKGFKLIDSVLKWCSEAEMYLILDLHGAPGGQGKDADISDYDPSKPSLWESQLNKDKTIALWRKLAERYRDEPWIGGFDLINETNWTFPEGNNSQLRQLMVDITTAIREVNQNHIIFVEGNGFANDFSGMTPPWDDNMAYSFHKYWNYNTQESLNFAINLRNTHNVPIWMGESGENSNAWFTSLLALLEANRIGWAMWPLKKPGINNPLRVIVNQDYTDLINFWRGTAANPGADAAFAAVMKFAENHRLENCFIQRDVIDAMIRQPHTNETIPFHLYTVGEPVFTVDYDLGRNGYAYFDRDTANFHLNTNVFTAWNQGWSYRNDGVDIERCNDTETSNGYNVGWTQDGEWMQYTLVSDSAAAYTLSIRHASGSGGSRVRFTIDEASISEVIHLPGTNGWQNWRTAEIPGIILPKGTFKTRLLFERGGSNLNYFMFSDPLHTDSIAFRQLYAQSAIDGKSIQLVLNKPVTSSVFDISKFEVVCGTDIIPISSIAPDEINPTILRIKLEEPLYFGALIRISYSGNKIESHNDVLAPFASFEVKNNLPVRTTIPATIQAENFFFNNGMVAETTTDTGGGQNMGYAAPGKYMDYLIHVPEDGHYTINFRVASLRSFSELTVQIGEEEHPFTSLNTLVVSGTGGWQSWVTRPLHVTLPKGRYTMRLFIKSGEFNINWFQIVKSTNVSVVAEEEKTIQLFPNPASHFVTLDLKGFQDPFNHVILYNLAGQAVKELQIADETAIIPLSGIQPGLYIMKVKNRQSIIYTSKIIIQ